MNKYDENLNIMLEEKYYCIEKIKSADDSIVEAVENKDGDWVPKFNSSEKSFFIHSKYAPYKEAQRFLSDIEFDAYNLFVVFGFGYGYHLELMLEKMPVDSYLLVIEKNAGIVKSAIKNRKLKKIISDKRLLLLIDPTEDDISVILKGKSSYKITFVTHRGSHQIDPEYYSNVSNIVKSYLSSKEANIATLSKFEKLWSTNIAANILQLLKNPGVNIFYDEFPNYNALVIGAGPSLVKSMDFIKQNKDRLLLIAVDTAYYLLKKEGVEPHFCITADPQIINARYFENSTETKTVLVTDPVTHPSIFRFYKGRKVICSPAFDTYKWIEKFSGVKGEITHGGSVSTNAVDFAYRLGVKKIYLIGQDLAFTGGYAHAKGSYLDEQIHNVSNRLLNVQMINRRQLTALPKIMMDGISTNKVHTNQKMVIFLNWFENHADYNLVNITYDGAYIKNVQHLKMEEICFAEKVNIADYIDELYNTNEINALVENKNKVASKIQVFLNEIAALKDRLNTAVKYSEELCHLIKNNSSDKNRFSYIIKKLDSVDDYIKSRTGVKDMIGLTVQKVIHTITEGYELQHEDSGKSTDLISAERSLFFYKGMNDGVFHNEKILKRMNSIISQ